MTSANIVGYQTIAAPAAGKYVSLSVQFNPVDGSTNTINSLFTYSSGTPKGTPVYGTAADCLWIWDETLSSGSGNWAKYFYRTASKGFCLSGTTTLATTLIPPGSTVLFYRGTGAQAAQLTLSGGVEPLKSDVVQSGLKAGKYRFMCYPWPVSFNINKIAACQKAPKGTPVYGTAADCVWLWDATLSGGSGNWAKYFYRTASKGYCLSGKTTLADVEIPAGQGFLFYRGTGAADEVITFKGPEEAE